MISAVAAFDAGHTPVAADEPIVGDQAFFDRRDFIALRTTDIKPDFVVDFGKIPVAFFPP